MTNTTPTHLSSKVSLEILINGRPITQHKHNKRVYVEGRSNSEYSIKVKNDNEVSVYAILSVDGLSIIDGTQASENSIGFLIEKQSFITVPGWIVSEKAAAKFKFSEIKNSYSEVKDKENINNIGVIGCIIIAEKVAEKSELDNVKDELEKIKEKQKKFDDLNKVHIPYIPYPIYPTPYWDHYYNSPRPYWYWNNGLGVYQGTLTPTVATSCIPAGSYSSSWNTIENSSGSLNNFSFANTCNAVGMATGSLDSSFADLVSCPLGTGFGDKTKLKDANFEKSFDIGEIVKSFVIYYDSRKNLEKLGIIFDKKKVSIKEPNPFPASKIKFCEPPENWEQ